MLKHFTNGVFLIKIRPISKETMTNFNFQRNSFVIKPLTTVRFSKPDIFVFKKIKLQTSVSPKLNRFSLVFNFVGKRNFLSTKCICFGRASIQRHPPTIPVCDISVLWSSKGYSQSAFDMCNPLTRMLLLSCSCLWNSVNLNIFFFYLYINTFKQIY